MPRNADPGHPLLGIVCRTHNWERSGGREVGPGGKVDLAGPQSEGKARIHPLPGTYREDRKEMSGVWCPKLPLSSSNPLGQQFLAPAHCLCLSSVFSKSGHQGLCKLTSEAAGSQAQRSPAPWCAQMHSSARPHHMHTAISRSITGAVAMATGCQLPRSWPLWNHTAYPSQVITLFHGSQPWGWNLPFLQTTTEFQGKRDKVVGGWRGVGID